MKNAEYYIKALGLKKHPEGGWFTEVYRSDETISKENLPERFPGERNFSTSIYFLLTSESFSALHRIKSDELWHFHAGSACTIYMIGEAGNYSEIILGNDLDNGEVFQCVIPKCVWFGAKVNSTESFTLCGCTVSPGFDFEDFELGKREELVKLFPQHKTVIEKLTRK
ncbi:MAG: cupin domain-containing protein [Ignavibacteria bacterium]|nr:cupin domain-containing protein [Ignavibacteria bacterium]